MSVTAHTTFVEPTRKLAGALLVTLATPQLSAVTGVPRLTLEAVHKPGSVFTTLLVGHEVMTGGVVSTKVMCCVQIEDWPLRLVAVQMRSTPAWPVQLVVATSL